MTPDAERMRLGKGQQTRSKAGHEVLASCAYALRDLLASKSPTVDLEGLIAQVEQLPIVTIGRSYEESAGYEACKFDVLALLRGVKEQTRG